MLILGLETSTSRSSVALVDADRVVASAAVGVPRRHAEFLAPAIEFCLRQGQVEAEDITGVAVGLGPGLYTGLRIGIATAQAFAEARQLPVVGLSGLDVLAFNVRYARKLICAALDARRGELYWAFYRSAPGGVQRQTDLRIGTAETLAGEIEGAGEVCLVIGDAVLSYREELHGLDAELAGIELAWPDAADLAELAVPRFVREETQRPLSLQPIYLRQPDAALGWKSRRLRSATAAESDGDPDREPDEEAG